MTRHRDSGGYFYILDWMLRGGIGWFTHYPIWRTSAKFWWRYPLHIRPWRIDVILWPASVFIEISYQPRWLRKMTPTQIKWLVHQAFEDLVQKQEAKDA